jgi:hypothetical protein
MKIDPLGVIVLLISIGLLLMLLTRTTAEHFTSAKGTYPSWTTITQDVKQTLSKYYTYSFSEFLTYADQSKIGTSEDQFYTLFVKPMFSSVQLPYIGSSTSMIDVKTMSEGFTHESIVPFLKGQVFDATRPYDMAVILLEANRALLLAVINDPGKYINKGDSIGSAVIEAYQQLRGLETIAVILRSYAYFYLFDFPNQSNVKATEK